MQYSLGNMLKGGGALNPDGLALDLAFALDRSFTTDPAAAGNALITSRRGPAAKFSRGSGATQVNAAGLIEYAPENLILRSEEFNEISWAKLNNSSGAVPVVTPNAVLSPTGTLTADLVAFPAVPVGENPRLEQNRSSIAGSSFVFSFWIRSDSPTTVRVGHLTPSITVSATTEWVRVSYAFTFTSGGFPQIVGPISGAASNVYLWGAQLERASTARTYYPTTTSAFYGPRFDHDPATGVCKGLLIEELRTNLAFPSDMSSPWSVSRLTATPATGSPLGTYQILTVTDTSGAARLSRTVVVPSSQPYTISVFAKAGTVSIFRFRALTDASSSVDFNLSNGTTSGSGNLGWSGQAQIIPYPDGWYRCSMTYTPTALSQNYCVDLVYTGIGQTIDFTGFQLEAGAFPLSYIPTTSGTAARSADVCSIIGTDFSSFYNQSEGSMFADATPQAVDQTAVVIGVNTTASTSSHFIYKANSAISANGKRWAAATVSVAGVQSAIATSTDVAVSRASLSYAYKLNDFAFAYNGTIVGTDNSGTMPTPTVMRIGARDDGLQLNGHIARIQYFRKRLSNAKLQTLTTP